MKTKHTPARWTRPQEKGTLIYAAEYHPGMTGYIASVNHCKDSETTNANARLIAAAPELLEALTSLFEQCVMIHKYGGSADNTREADAAIAAARAAIQKASR